MLVLFQTIQQNVTQNVTQKHDSNPAVKMNPVGARVDVTTAQLNGKQEGELNTRPTCAAPATVRLQGSQAPRFSPDIGQQRDDADAAKQQTRHQQNSKACGDAGQSD
jgi:hypothetical protein